MSDKTVDDATIESNVPGKQNLRGVNNSETVNTACEESSEIDCHYEPVITVTKQESSITKGDIKTQKITVTEDVSNGVETNTETTILETGENEAKQMTAEAVKVEDRPDGAEKPQKEDKAKTKIPMRKLRRAMREITDNRKTLKEADRQISVQKRKSSIPRLKELKTSTLLSNNINKEEPMSIISPRTDEEFDKIFEEIVVKENSPSFIKDPEKLDSKFEEIIHAYDENKIEPINIEKNKSRIPMLKRKSEHDIEITKRIDRKSAHKKRLSIDNTHNSDPNPKSLILHSTSIENNTSESPIIKLDNVEQFNTTESELIENSVESNTISLPIPDTNTEKLSSTDTDVFSSTTIKTENDTNTKFETSEFDNQSHRTERNLLKKSFSVDNNSAEIKKFENNLQHKIRRTVSHQNERNSYDTLSSNVLVQKIVKEQVISDLANTEQNKLLSNNAASTEYLLKSDVQNSIDNPSTCNSVKYDSTCQETSSLIRKITDAGFESTDIINNNVTTSNASNQETISNYLTIEFAQPGNNVDEEMNIEHNEPQLQQQTVLPKNIYTVPSEVTIEVSESKLEENVEEQSATEINDVDISLFQTVPQINDQDESSSYENENEKSKSQEDIVHIGYNDNDKAESENEKLKLQTSVTIDENFTQVSDVNLQVSPKEEILDRDTEHQNISALDNDKKPSTKDISSTLMDNNELEFTKNEPINYIQNPEDTQKDNELDNIPNSRESRFEENSNDINNQIEGLKEKRIQDKHIINDLLKTDMPEEEIIILKGKVNRVISRLDSKDYTECKSKQNIVGEVPNKAVLSKIALFEQKDAVEKHTPKKTSHCHSLISGDLPKIVDELLKTQVNTDPTTDLNRVENTKHKVTWSKIDKNLDSDKINKNKKFTQLKSIDNDEYFDEKYKINKEPPRIEIKRELSYAETDLGDSIKGKVRQMVVRMVSLERMDLDKKGIIDIKDKPRSGSVSEKIALFEKQVTPLKIAKANTLKNQTKEVSEENMSEEEFNSKVEELLGAKKKYGRITDLKYIELNDGCMMPAIGVGTALLSKNLTKHIVSTAIELGYRTIDTAYIYGNEKEIGDAINEKINDGTVRREDLFVISKLWSTFHRRDLVEKACKLSLKAMGLDYFDLYLIHNPMSFKEGGNPIPKIANVIQYSETDYLDAWYGVEQVVKKGLARRAGVSNFNSAQLDRIIDKGRLKPVVNQVECHPYLTQYRLDEFCQSRDVKMSSFGVLGSKGTPLEVKSGLSPVIDDPMVLTMAAGLGVTPAQLLISYQLHLDHGVVVKASSGSRLWSNLQSQQVRLDASHISALNALNRNKRNFTFKGFGDTHRNYPFRIPF